MEMKNKFRNFILNDIFYFDKSELNFGIYKIFRQKQKLIENIIDEIIEEVENELSTNQNIKELQKILEDELPGKIYKQIDFENINLEELKNKIKEYVSKDILEKLNSKNYSPTKIYEYLYQFFNLYYETGDFGYTTRSFNVYKIPFNDNFFCEDSQEIDYKGEETLFTWKTKDSYYIKSNKFLNTLNLKLKFNDKEYNIKADVVGKDEIKDDKKVKQYRLVSIRKKNNTIYLKFNLSDTPTPKHTIYLLILVLIETTINEIKYDELDEEIKSFFENIPLKEIVTSSLFDNSGKIIEKYKEIYKKYYKYLIKDNKNIFKFKFSGNEDEKQIKSKVSQLMISKKDYASKVYNKTEVKKYLEVKKFDFDDKNDREKLYEKDKVLDFFYKLDRGINLFFAGVDSDYFIHKNLKRFLLIELDKFIKNYIFTDTDALLDMRDNQLFKFAKIFKKEAIKIIELLNSIEEFQKYIWEKRKLIKETHYIISSNKLKDELLKKVLENENQINEWIEYLKLCEKKPDLKELKEKPYPIDTKYFNESFKYKVLSQFDNLEEEIDGILIKSENFQALKFLEHKFKERIKCIYIDPPYNTGSDGFVYKDNYKEASWLSMMNDRLRVAKELMKDDGVIFNQIDDNSEEYIKLLHKKIFNFLNKITIRVKAAAGFKIVNPGVMETSEYIYISYKKDIPHFSKQYKKVSYDTNYKFFIENINDAPKTWKIQKIDDVLNFTQIDKLKDKSIKQHLKNYLRAKFALENAEKVFRYTEINKDAGKDTLKIKEKSKKSDKVFTVETEKGIRYIHKGKQITFYINKIKEFDGEKSPSVEIDNIWDDISWQGIAKEGNITLNKGKKPEKLIERIINLSIPKESREWVLDFFAGSGTTPAVAYKMNKKFIGIEINDYFDDLILKRMKYTMFGNSGGIKSKKNSGIIQYIYLEQYDDIIDNLKTKDEIEKLEVEAKYIYNPDKNRIDFRIEGDIKKPFNGSFDIFHSFIYHKGYKLKKVNLKNNILIGELDNNRVVIIGEDESKVIETIEKYRDKEIYTNIKYPNTNEIDVYTFKGI